MNDISKMIDDPIPNDDKITPEFTDRVLEFAQEMFDYVMNEIQGGDFQGKFNELTEQEKAGFFASLADGFNDEVNS